MANLAFSNLDMNRLQVKNQRADNRTTAERTTLGASLTGAHEGLFVYDSDLNKMFFWNGSAWVDMTPVLSGGVTYLGGVAHNATVPPSPNNGDMYRFTSAGVNTWTGSQTVQIGDFVIYNGTSWDYWQTNVDQATTTTLGLVRLATQAEVNTGTDAEKVVTPATLQGKLSTYPRKFLATNQTLVANTPLTVTHNLGLANRNAFTYSVFDSSHKAVFAEINSVDVNSFTITAGVAATGVTITVIG